MAQLKVLRQVRRHPKNGGLGLFPKLAYVIFAVFAFGLSSVSSAQSTGIWWTAGYSNFDTPDAACVDYAAHYNMTVSKVTQASPIAYACWRPTVFGDDNFAMASRVPGCAFGYILQSDGSCKPPVPPPPVLACAVGHPVIPGTGTKILLETDNGGSADLPLTRSYRSNSVFASNGGVGRWVFNWQRQLDTNFLAYVVPQISALRSDGSTLVFLKTGANWVASGTQDTLQPLTDANGKVTGWQYGVTNTGEVEKYDANGKLLSVRERNGRTTTLIYNAKAQLAQVTAPSGRSLTFAYDTQNRVSSITAPDGAVTMYAYNASGMLSSVAWPDNTVRQYVYEDTRFPTALTGVIDEAGVRYATYAYDDQGRAITSELTAGADRYQFQYQANNQTIVTQPSGTTSTYTFLKQNGVLLPTGVSAPCPTCGSTAQSTSYDANNNPTSKTGYDGSTTTYVYDALGRETQRVVGAGTADAKTTTTEWDSQQWLVTRVAAPNQIDTFSYDANGNLLSHTVTPTGDANGSQAFAAAASGSIKRTDWTYDDSGHVLTATERTDGAITGTWTLAYDGQGNLQTLTNPDGKTGRITLYDAAGRVLEAVDVNGIAIKFGYNARGWVTDYDYGEQHVRYEYDAIGLRTAMVGPQTLVMRYVYDAAHRLTQILDNVPAPQGDTGTQTAASPTGTFTIDETVVQSFREMVMRGWYAVLDWMKQQLAGLIASAHAQVIPAPGAGGALALPPIPNVSLPTTGLRYPEDALDSGAAAVMSKVRPPGMTRLEERHYDRTCSKSADPCTALKDAAQTAIKEAKVKMNNMLNDKVLYKNAYDTPNPAVTGTNTTWIGHVKDLDGRIANIWAMIYLGRKMGCDMSIETAAATTLLTPGAPL